MRRINADAIPVGSSTSQTMIATRGARGQAGGVRRIQAASPTLITPNQQCSQAEADQERRPMHVAHRGKHDTSQ
jgi:hypothetical protein